MKRMEEALIRKDDPDVIYIGDIAEKFYNSAAGDLLRAICRGKQGEAIEMGEQDLRIPADRTVGRVEAYQNVINAVEQAIADGKELQRPLEPDEIEKNI